MTDPTTLIKCNECGNEYALETTEAENGKCPKCHGVIKEIPECYICHRRTETRCGRMGCPHDIRYGPGTLFG